MPNNRGSRRVTGTQLRKLKILQEALPDGFSGGIQDEFETVASNLDSIDGTAVQEDESTLVITYMNGITKTVETTDTTVTVTLSGSVPAGVQTEKTITLTGDDFTINYS